MTPKTARQLGIRLDPEQSQRVAAFEAQTGVEGVTLFRNAGLAALTYFEDHKEISFPLRIISIAAGGKDSTTAGKDSTDYRSIPPPVSPGLNQLPALEPVILPTTAHEAEMLRKGAAMRKAARSPRSAKPDRK